ncbi:hypothetical protein BJQ90_00017 [Arthrobacter sp. SO3]|nr:hypothetical protein [Arthrobacter sp. SO3]
MKRLRGKDASGLVLLRADSAFYGHPVVAAAHRAGAKVSITARMDPAVKRAIATINEKAWTTIQYTDAVRDETTGAWISSAEVAETAFTAFVGRKKAERVHGRLVVRRIPELNAKAGAGQQTLFDTHRFHAFFTTSALATVAADKTHRQRGLAGPGDHRLQPLARHRHPLRQRPGQSTQRHHPPKTHHRPRQDRDLGTEDHPAPGRSLALGNQLVKALRSRLRATTDRRHLTTQPTRRNQDHGTPPAAMPGTPSCPPTEPRPRSERPRPIKHSRWIEA